MFKIKNIIVPTDFSKLSTSAFEYAKDLAEQMDAKIHLIYVMEKTPPLLSSRDSEVSEDEVMQSIYTQSSKRLKQMAEELRDETELQIAEVLRVGTDYEEIIKYAKESCGDLIVLATHGRTGVLHTVMGSVAEKVIQYVKCPVLVIKPEEEE
jgi:universal stress protein A